MGAKSVEEIRSPSRSKVQTVGTVAHSWRPSVSSYIWGEVTVSKARDVRWYQTWQGSHFQTGQRETNRYDSPRLH